MKKSDRTLKLDVSIWVAKDKRIRIAERSGKIISTVSDQPGKRCHKHLYAKFKKRLQGADCWPFASS